MILLFYLNTVIYGIDIFINIAAFAVGVLGLGYSIFLYISFRQRDPTDFDKVMYEPPGTISADQAASNASANYSNDDVPFRTSSDSTTNMDGTGNLITGNIIIGNGTGSGMYGNIGGNGNLTIGNGTGSGMYGNIGANEINLNNMPMNGRGYGDLSSNIYNSYNNANYDYQYNNTYNTYGNGNSGENGLFGTGPIPTDPDKTIGTVTTTSTPVTPVNFNIPKLITNEIYLGDTGRDTILILDQKTFVLFNLHKGKYLFKSLDNVFFTNPTNSKFTATVVTTGPDSKFGVKLLGKGIMVTINSTDTYYFYPSNIPATLRDNDVFLGSSGQKIEVISKNKFNLLNLTNESNINSNSTNIQRTYYSTDGYFFIDTDNASNVAKIVVQGPDANTADFNKIIYGQAILLSNDNTGQKTYYYYNGNTGPTSSDFDDIPDNVFSETPPLPAPTTTAAPTTTTAAPTTTTTTTTPTPKISGLKWIAYKPEDPNNTLNTKDINSYPNIPMVNKKYHTFQFFPKYNNGANTSSSNVNNRMKIIDYENNIAYWNNNSDSNMFGFRSNKSYNNNVNNAGVYIALVMTGYFKPDVTGIWMLYLEADDGAILWINDTSNHWPPTDTNYNVGPNTIYPINLTAGNYYPMQITYWQGWGSSKFKLIITPPGGKATMDGSKYFFSDP